MHRSTTRVARILSSRDKEIDDLHGLVDSLTSPEREGGRGPGGKKGRGEAVGGPAGEREGRGTRMDGRGYGCGGGPSGGGDLYSFLDFRVVTVIFYTSQCCALPWLKSTITCYKHCSLRP